MQLIVSNPIEDVRPVPYAAPARTILTLTEAKKLMDEASVAELWAVPDPILRQLTGHSTEQMTEHYSHFDLEAFKPIVAIEESLGI